MKITENLIWELSNKAINTLGESASPDKIREFVENEIAKMTGSNQTGTEKFQGRVILTSFGVNRPGIVAKITGVLADLNCDLQDISQKIMQEFFTLIMMIDITNSPKNFREIQEELNKVSAEMNIKIFVQHEDIFQYMFRI